MRAIKPPGRRPRFAAAAAGATTIEFALLFIYFLTLVFGIIEVARLLFVFNTLQEVTRRAAAAAVNVYPSDANAIARVKQYAVFRDTPGALMLSPPVTDAHVRLDYLTIDLAVIPPASWPADAAANRQVCMLDPHAANCIRFVQARICAPGNAGACGDVTSRTLLPLIELSVPLHKATTIATVESLGYVPGTPPPQTPPPEPPCPCGS
jgi:hypothetical protein